MSAAAVPDRPGRKKENAENRLAADPEAKCYLPGVPRITYMPYPFQIVQTPSQLALLYEYVHAMRNVFVGSDHPSGHIDWWMGDSRARWEGDTLFRRCHPLQRRHLVSRREFSQRRTARGGALYAHLHINSLSEKAGVAQQTRLRRHHVAQRTQAVVRRGSTRVHISSSSRRQFWRRSAIATLTPDPFWRRTDGGR